MQNQHGRTFRNFTFLLLGILLCTGCASNPNVLKTWSAIGSESLRNNPSPLPDFLDQVSPLPSAKGAFRSGICAELSGAALWEPGDKADDPVNWPGRLQLYLDGQEIRRGADQPVYAGGLLVQAYDAKNNVIGSYVMGYSTCFKIAFSRGVHKAVIRVSTTSGQVYWYAWAFEVTPE